jgi:hypothetical protein
MSRSYAHVSLNAASSAAKVATLGAFCLIAVGSSLAAAQPHKAKVDPRAMQANSSSTFEVRQTCIPANGAQILGGFAGGDDLIDVRTGEICGKR